MIPAIINPARVPNTMPTTADAHHGRPVARPVIQPSPTMDPDHASEPAPDSHRNTGQRIPPIPAAAIDAVRPPETNRSTDSPARLPAGPTRTSRLRIPRWIRRHHAQRSRRSARPWRNSA